MSNLPVHEVCEVFYHNSFHLHWITNEHLRCKSKVIPDKQKTQRVNLNEHERTVWISRQIYFVNTGLQNILVPIFYL